jgi:hypothetical protein
MRAVENDTVSVPPVVKVPDGGVVVYPLGGSTVYVAPDVNPANVIELADVYFVRPAIVTPHIVPVARPLSVNVSTNVPDAIENVIDTDAVTEPEFGEDVYPCTTPTV